MNNSSLFYGFRGNIVFPDQQSIFNLGLKNDSESKNKIFGDFFEMIREQKKLESHYQNRVYFLIFKNMYDNIFHCQLARKKQFNKRDIIDNNIIEFEDSDYPYINIFVELKSQKFLIESNTQVFENYNTCSNVIENIINNNLKDKDVKIVLNPIIEEEKFWSYINDKNKIYNIEFKLVRPNAFDAEDDVDTLLREAEKNVGAEIVNINFCNPEGKLRPHKVGINSYIKYISNGGGSWKMTRLGSNGKKEKISSKQKSTKVNIPLLCENLMNKTLSKDEIESIIMSFKKIEAVEKFMEER